GSCYRELLPDVSLFRRKNQHRQILSRSGSTRVEPPIGSTNILSKKVRRVVLLPATEPAFFTRNRVFGWRRLSQHGSARQGFGLQARQRRQISFLRFARELFPRHYVRAPLRKRE